MNKEKLQHPNDPTIINLDPVIAEVVLVKGENLVVTFRWDKLTSRVTSKVIKVLHRICHFVLQLLIHSITLHFYPSAVCLNIFIILFSDE